MSTRIYNGYKLPKMTLEELHTFTMRIRKEAANVNVEIAAELHANLITDVIDNYCVLSQEDFFKGYTSVKETDRPSTYSTFEIIKGYKPNPEYDGEILFNFNFNVIFIPSETKTLALLYTEQEKFEKFWENIPGIEEYHYQNQVDRPMDISKAEWEQRRDDWDKALPGIGIPNLSGFKATICQEPPITVRKEKIVEKIPPFEKRLKQITQMITQKNLFEQKEIKGSKVFGEISKFLQTEEGKMLLQKNAEQIRPKLIPEITVDIIKTPLNEIRKF